MTSLPQSRERFQKKYILAAALPTIGVFTSSEVNKLIQNLGFRPDAARQNVRRSKSEGEIWRTEKLVLSRNERLFAKTSFTKSPEFMSAVIKKLTLSRPGMARCLIELQHKEVLLISQVARLLASPVDAKMQRTYPSLENELEGLAELPFVRRDGQHGPLDRLCLSKLVDFRKEKVLAQRALVRKYLEDKLTDVILYQFAIQNMISWRAVGRDVGHQFNNYPFSGFSFSHLRPLLRVGHKDARPKPMPIVFDIYSGTIGKESVEGFLERIARAGYNKNRNFSILGVIAAQNFLPEAWRTAKKSGLIAINLTQMFGTQGFEVLLKAEDILSQIPSEGGDITTTNFDALTKLISELKANPWFTELRGLAFEAVTGFILSSKNWQDLRMDFSVPAEINGEATSRQVDISGTRSSRTELIVVECKGEIAEKELDPSYVRKFFTETLPAFLKNQQDQHHFKEVRAEIWTTGLIGDGAKKELASLKLKPKITPALRDLGEISDDLLPSQDRLKRLLSVIAVKGLESKSKIQDLAGLPSSA